jgi:hypothetical protein
VCLLVALFAAAAGNGAVSAEPPEFPTRRPAAVPAIAVSEAVPSRTLGIAAQDSWLGE